MNRRRNPTELSTAVSTLLDFPPSIIDDDRLQVQRTQQPVLDQVQIRAPEPSDAPAQRSGAGTAEAGICQIANSVSAGP